MKKVINGKRYNTETAKSVAWWTNNKSYTDFGWCEEELFQKRTGEFFLYGQGGASTIYSRQTGENSWMAGEEIIPVSEKRAKLWVANRLGEDKIDVIFGKTYYIAENEFADGIYGDQYPVCLDKKEVERLSREWGKDIFSQMHEATRAEIEEFGVYDSDQ